MSREQEQAFLESHGAHYKPNHDDVCCHYCFIWIDLQHFGLYRWSLSQGRIPENRFSSMCFGFSTKNGWSLISLKKKADRHFPWQGPGHLLPQKFLLFQRIPEGRCQTFPWLCVMSPFVFTLPVREGFSKPYSISSVCIWHWHRNVVWLKDTIFLLSRFIEDLC